MGYKTQRLRRRALSSSSTLQMEPLNFVKHTSALKTLSSNMSQHVSHLVSDINLMSCAMTTLFPVMVSSLTNTQTFPGHYRLFRLCSHVCCGPPRRPNASTCLLSLGSRAPNGCVCHCLSGAVRSAPSARFRSLDSLPRFSRGRRLSDYRRTRMPGGAVGSFGSDRGRYGRRGTVAGHVTAGVGILPPVPVVVGTRSLGT